jgi:hypothetical protein
MYGSTNPDSRLRAMQAEYELLEKQRRLALIEVESIERKMARNVKRAQAYCATLNQESAR